MTRRVARIPEWAIGCRELAASDWRIYACVSLHAKSDGTGAFPSMETLAAMTGIRRQDVPRSLLRLVQLGLLRRSRQSVGGGWRNNQYEVVLDAPVSAELRTDQGVRNLADRVSAKGHRRCPQKGARGVRKIAALTKYITKGLTDSSNEAAEPSAKDPQKEVYDRGREILGKKAGGVIRNLLRHTEADCDRALRLLLVAESKSDPREYIGGVLRGNGRADDVLADTQRLYRDLGVS